MNKPLDYTDEDMADVSDNPEWTGEDFAQSQPFHVLFPDLATGLYGDDASAAGTDEDHVPVAIDRDIVDRFKAGGFGWQTRLNDALRKAVDAES